MKSLLISLRLFAILTLLTGFIYPALISGFGEILFYQQAHGSLLKGKDGTIQGSKWIGQKFTDKKYFFSRPSNVDYQALPSGGSNLSWSSQSLKELIAVRQSAGLNGEMLSASASGLDPHVSPESAYQQIGRVAAARGMSVAEVRSIVEMFREKRTWKIFGEERINVLLVNRALDERQKH